MQKTGILLGIDQESLSDRCSDYTELFVVKTMKEGDPDRQLFIDFIREKFSYDELVFMTMFWLQDKTEDIYLNYMKSRLESLKNGTQP